MVAGMRCKWALVGREGEYPKVNINVLPYCAMVVVQYVHGTYVSAFICLLLDDESMYHS